MRCGRKACRRRAGRFFKTFAEPAFFGLLNPSIFLWFLILGWREKNRRKEKNSRRKRWPKEAVSAKGREQAPLHLFPD
jgi:polyferredoxin